MPLQSNPGVKEITPEVLSLALQLCGWSLSQLTIVLQEMITDIKQNYGWHKYNTWYIALAGWNMFGKNK